MGGEGGGRVGHLCAERKRKGYVGASTGVVCQFVSGVSLKVEKVGAQSDRQKPLAHAVKPSPMLHWPLLVVRGNKVLDFHLLKLAAPEDKVAGGDFVPEGLSHLKGHGKSSSGS